MSGDRSDLLRDMGPGAQEWYDGDSDSLDVKVERAFIEPGRTLSPEAVHLLNLTITRFMLARMLRRWDDTGEPPTMVAVHVDMDIA